MEYKAYKTKKMLCHLFSTFSYESRRAERVRKQLQWSPTEPPNINEIGNSGGNRPLFRCTHPSGVDSHPAQCV